MNIRFLALTSNGGALVWMFALLLAGNCFNKGETLCLTDGILPADRKNITIGGEDMPLGFNRGGWPSVRVLTDVAIIMVQEVLGYNAIVSRVAGDGPSSYYAVSGCKNLAADTIAEKQCGQDHPFSHHASMELWPGASKTQIAMMTCCPSIAAVQARSLGYTGDENMYLFPKSYEPAAEAFVSINYYKSWNASGNDLTTYFSKVTDINLTQYTAPCSDLEGLFVMDDEIALFLSVTNDYDAIETIGTKRRFKCWKDTFILGPGCRNPADPDDTSKCIPYFTIEGYQTQQTLQKMSVYNMAIAWALASNWGTWEALPQVYKCLSYWFEPATEFLALRPLKVTFPPSNLAAWSRGVGTDAFPKAELRSFVAQAIKNNYEQLFKLLSAVDMSGPEIDDALLEFINGGRDSYVIACNFIKSNRDRVMSWMPSDFECSSGAGLRNADGGYKINSILDAQKCDWCPPGRFSKPLSLVGATGQTKIPTYTCDACQPGEKQSVGGTTECATCPEGTFSSTFAATECKLCSIGSYQPEKHTNACSRCPTPMVTTEAGSLSKTDCICPAGSARPCRDPATSSNIRVGCKCDPSVYLATASTCFVCPNGTTCDLGSDEIELPCSVDDEDPNLKYPRPLPQHYTSFSSPLDVFKCKDAAICPGNQLQACGPHAFGLACGLCEDGYYKEVSGQCVACGGAFSIPIIPIVLVVAAPLGILAMYKFNGDRGVQQWHTPQNDVMGIMYITLVFVQTLGTNIDIMPATPLAIDSMFGWTPAVSDLMSQLRLDCMSSATFETKFVMKLLAPIYGGLLFLCMYAVLYPSRYRLDKDIFIGIYGSLFNALFISIMNLSLTLLQLYEHPNGQWSMRLAPAILKNSEVWTSLSAGTAIALLFYCVGAVSACVYAVVYAPSKFNDLAFRKRWKFLLLQMRPSVYWWMIASMLKGLYLSLTTVVCSSPMAQTVWLGIGLFFYFIGVFYFLPWYTSPLLWLDVTLHYVLAAMCFIMPYFVPAAENDLLNAVILFLIVTLLGFIIGLCCIIGIFYTQSPSTQRSWYLTYDKDARMFVEVFQAMDDAHMIADILSQLPDVDYSLSVHAMKMLSVEMLGNREGGRLQWRKQGVMGDQEQAGSEWL